jgi:hypothetical protein
MQVLRSLQDDQTDVLILLVGDNPLPNAVSAALLARPNTRIILLYSDDTAEIAANLKAWLVGRIPFRSCEYIKVDEADPVSIWKAVQRSLDGAKSTSIGLNYTGGTKLMAVHAHRAVESWSRHRGLSPTYTYLNASTLRMVTGPVQPETGEPSRSVYTGDALQMDLEELLGLHSWTFKAPPNRVPLLPAFAGAIARLCGGAAMQSWLDWQKQACTQPATTPLAFPGDPAWGDLRQTFQVETGLDPAHFQLQDLTPQVSLHGAVSYLQGFWLEHYLLAQVIAIRDRAGLSDVGHSIMTAEVNFELDLAALRGYQLFAFSCATLHPGGGKNEHKAAKLKLFEAYVRATQIGGDEANVALVCLTQNSAHLERELSEMVLAPDKAQKQLNPRVKVFGQKELPDLGQHILHWIEDRKGKDAA